MPEIDESQIKIALSAVEDARPKYSIRQADLSERSQILTNQRAVENLLASFLMKAGFEVDKFDKIRTQNQTELRRIVEKQNADALKHSSSVKDTLRYGVDSRRKTIEYLATLAPPLAPATYVTLDSPFFIWPTDGISWDRLHIEPWNSLAKFKVESQGPSDSREKLRFLFLWVNPSDSPAVINVTSILGLNGFCDAQTDGGYSYDPERYAAIVIDPYLRLFEWWNQPPTQPLWQDNQEHRALSLFADARWPFDFDGDFKADPVKRSYFVDYNMFMIPPNGTVVFEVGVEVHYSISQFGHDDGNIHVDFTNGDREVTCPAVWIQILT